MDLRQGAACLGRTAHSASRPPLCARGEGSSCRRAGTRPWASSRSRLKGLDGRRIGGNRRRSCRRGGDVRAEAALRADRLAECRLPPGWRGSSIPRLDGRPICSIHHRGHRPGRCHPSHRHRSAPEAAVLNARILKRWRQASGKMPIGAHRRGCRPDLCLRLSRRRPETLAKIADGSHSFRKALKASSGRC